MSKNTVKIDKILKMMDQKTRKEWLPVERALFHLLKQHKEELPELNNYFHKAFRQVDVINDGSGHMDMAIYNLLDASKIFWEYFEIVCKEGGLDE